MWEDLTVQENVVLVLVNEEFTRKGDGGDIRGYGSDSPRNVEL